MLCLTNGGTGKGRQKTPRRESRGLPRYVPVSFGEALARVNGAGYFVHGRPRETYPIDVVSPVRSCIELNPLGVQAGLSPVLLACP